MERIDRIGGVAVWRFLRDAVLMESNSCWPGGCLGRPLFDQFHADFTAAAARARNNKQPPEADAFPATRWKYKKNNKKQQQQQQKTVVPPLVFLLLQNWKFRPSGNFPGHRIFVACVCLFVCLFFRRIARKFALAFLSSSAGNGKLSEPIGFELRLDLERRWLLPSSDLERKKKTSRSV